MLAKFYIDSYRGLSRNIWLLSLVMFINRSGAMVLPFLSIYLNQEIGISLPKCGIIMACFGLGAVAGAFIGGVLTDIFGYYRVMLTSLFLTAACFLIVMNLRDFHMLCVGFFSISFVADTFRPANLTAIEAFSKTENYTRSLGLVRLAINLGYAFGPFMGGYIASFLGYNFLFIFNAFSVFLAGIAFYSFFKSKKKKIEKSEKEEQEIRKLPWQDPPYMAYLGLWTVVAIVFFQLIYLVPLYFKTGLGFEESIVGMLMGLNGLIIFLIEMPLIFLIERYYRPVGLISTGGFLIGLGFLCFAIFVNPWVAALSFTLLITVGEILSFPFSNTYAMSFANERNRGKYMGLYTMSFAIAHVVAPLLWMYLAEIGGFNTVWLTGTISCTIACLLIYILAGRKD